MASDDELSLDVPWVEKYRPQEFKDVISQNLAINNLKRFLKSEAIPHLIFNGPAGTGKTSAALILAKKLLGDDCKERGLLLELNASDNVRMEYVRDILKEFVNQSLIANQSQRRNLKIVILDEADNIPGTVQQALRRIIEKSSGAVIFIFLCNYINRLIDPIISRCAVLRFAPLPKPNIIERLKYIIKSEKLKITNQKELLEQIYFISEGDLRKAINTLQMAVALKILDDLRIDELYGISGYVDNNTVEKLYEAMKTKDFTEILKIINSIKGYSTRNLMRQLYLKIAEEKNLDDSKIAKIYNLFGDYDFRMTMGAEVEIQMISLLNLISWELK
jgi:replication factor C small subunit